MINDFSISKKYVIGLHDFEPRRRLSKQKNIVSFLLPQKAQRLFTKDTKLANTIVFFV